MDYEGLIRVHRYLILKIIKQGVHLGLLKQKGRVPKRGDKGRSFGTPYHLFILITAPVLSIYKFVDSTLTIDGGSDYIDSTL